MCAIYMLPILTFRVTFGFVHQLNTDDHNLIFVDFTMDSSDFG